MLKKILFVICISILIAGAFARGKNKNLDPKVVDQSQEGQWNVRADLEKFVILLIPSPVESSSSSPSLIDFLFRSIAPGKFGKGAPNKKHHNGENYQDTKHFIESKTAPYHVDISTSKYQIGSGDTEDTLVANSPSVALVKNGADGSALMKKLKKIARNSKAIILTVNTDKNGKSSSVA